MKERDQHRSRERVRSFLTCELNECSRHTQHQCDISSESAALCNPSHAALCSTAAQSVMTNLIYISCCYCFNKSLQCHGWSQTQSELHPVMQTGDCLVWGSRVRSDEQNDIPRVLRECQRKNSDHVFTAIAADERGDWCQFTYSTPVFVTFLAQFW